MNIVSIEPTPSPNVMKCNLDTSLATGVNYNFSQKTCAMAPDHLQRLLSIPGVTKVFQVLDFISIERHPKADWQSILSEVKQMLGETERKLDGSTVPSASEGSFGEVWVYVQKLRQIPIQVKLVKDGEERRFGLPERFQEAVMKLQSVTGNLILERTWVEQGRRYGEVDMLGQQVVEEIEAAYNGERLQKLAGHNPSELVSRPKMYLSADQVKQALLQPDWKLRYAALEQFEPSPEDLDLLEQTLADEKTSIRRLAVVYLGYIGGKKVIPLLVRALKDPSPVVRRTAGDTISDIGDTDAAPAMCDALQDKNKLVRWRAARFLYEVGDRSCVSALRGAVDDPEFEVKLQVKMALERIERGEEASGTIWQQMTKAFNGNSKENK